MIWWSNIYPNKKEYPDFWIAYANLFQETNNHRVVVLDCETTGLNSKVDKMLSIGAVALHDQIICVEDSFSVYVKQLVHNPETVAIHGIVDSQTFELVPQQEAVEELLKFIGNAKIIGHHIQFDIEMINIALAEMQLPKLKNKVVDTARLYEKFKGVNAPMQKSLDELCHEFKIQKKNRHTALGDAFLTALVYQRLITH